MSSAFQVRPFGNTGINVAPLGLSASYLPGRHTMHMAAEEGINLFFSFGIDFQMIGALRRDDEVHALIWRCGAQSAKMVHVERVCVRLRRGFLRRF